MTNVPNSSRRFRFQSFGAAFNDPGPFHLLHREQPLAAGPVQGASAGGASRGLPQNHQLRSQLTAGLRAIFLSEGTRGRYMVNMRNSGDVSIFVNDRRARIAQVARISETEVSAAEAIVALSSPHQPAVPTQAAAVATGQTQEQVLRANAEYWNSNLQGLLAEGIGREDIESISRYCARIQQKLPDLRLEHMFELYAGGTRNRARVDRPLQALLSNASRMQGLGISMDDAVNVMKLSGYSVLKHVTTHAAALSGAPLQLHIRDVLNLASCGNGSGKGIDLIAKNHHLLVNGLGYNYQSLRSVISRQQGVSMLKEQIIAAGGHVN